MPVQKRQCEKCLKAKPLSHFGHRQNRRFRFSYVSKVCGVCEKSEAKDRAKDRRRKKAEYQKKVRRPLTLANQRKWSARTRNAITPHCRLCDRPLTLSNEGERTLGHTRECVWNPKRYRPTFKPEDKRKKGFNMQEIVEKRVRYEARCENRHDFITNLAEPVCPFCRSRECTAVLIETVEKPIDGDAESG